MTPQLQAILSKDREYNAGDMVAEIFGFSKETHYDLLVVAPGWKPTKILNQTDAEVTITAKHSYVSGYEVTFGDKRIAWAQTGSGACNLIDHLTLCVDMDFDKLVFVGAVGGLRSDYEVGDLCTPIQCVEGTMAPAYLMEDPREFRPFTRVVPDNDAFRKQVLAMAAQMAIPLREASVFCTDSISCEYYHLDFIQSFDTDLIEMETSAFYRLATMMEKPAIALLVVSDNSANGEPLIGKSEQQEDAYNRGRKVLIPRLLEGIAHIVL